jgi:superfamily II DNA or RNA helicase
MGSRRAPTVTSAAAAEAAPVLTPERAAIDRLGAFDLELLAALALQTEALSRTGWVEQARTHGIEAPGGRALAAKDIEPSGERLAAEGLVSTFQPTTRQIAYTVPASIAMHTLQAVHERGQLDRMVGAKRPHTIGYRSTSIHDSLVELRVAIIREDPAGIRAALLHAPVYNRNEFGRWLLDALGTAPLPSWIVRLPSDDVRVAWFATIVKLASGTLASVSATVIKHALMLDDKPLRLALGRVLALRGEGVRASAITGLSKWGVEGLELLTKFWAGDFAGALEIGERAFVARKQKPLPDLEGLCHLIAAIVVSSAQPEVIEIVGRLIRANASAKGQPGAGQFLEPVHLTLLGAEPIVRPQCTEHHRQWDWLNAFVRLLHDVWLRPAARTLKAGVADRKTPARAARALADGWRQRAEHGGYIPVARELAAMIDELDGVSVPHRLASAFHPPEPWEAALVGLEAALGHSEVGQASTATRELVWEVQAIGRGVDIQPRLRTSPRARKGQAIAVSRLIAGEHADLLTEADRRVLTTLTATADPWEFGYGRHTLGLAAMLALVGHPRVIGADGIARRVERGRPTIRTHAEHGLTKVELVPASLLDRALAIEFTGSDRIVVYERTRELEQLATILERGQGLAVPEAGRDRLARALTRLSLLASVEVEGDLQVAARDVEADPRLVIQIGWNGTSLAVRAKVAPLGPSGPMLYPGGGTAVLVADVRSDEGIALARCTRDLAEEQRRSAAVLDACPTLSGFADGELQWKVPTLHDALEIVLELDALGDQVVLAWQVGQKLDVPKRVDSSDFHIKVGASKAAWFHVEATLDVDEHSVMQFRELLRNREGPRFVALPRGRFLALSERLRRHVDRLATLGVEDGEGLRSAPAVLPLLEELAAETADPSFDATTLARLEQLRTIATLVPKLPRGFANTLRDYQREGFVWMARLAEAGLGACLADDMGLGKTVQALALLAHRARLGPALVVCPTSVVINWINEAARFAPSLRFVMLGTADDREALLESAGPRTVVVSSYTLLANEVELLAEVEFATLVFDEAHALKNSRTRRAMAARRMNAGFRLALTGTPIENHLGELWSLFAAILPGVLGSEAAFEQRFVNGVRDDRERAARLRSLLRPFVLRRLKSQVLDELPPRTEITLRVEPYPEQRAYYEAMRRLALERTAAMDRKKIRFQLLAEITRLRQAAIDPRLVDPDAAPKGAKLDVLIARLLELREEGHRALVFTQFLGSLAAIRDRLVAEGIEHFELEGSTPAAERARRIDAFQAGEGDVFLLSLRAGGMGINLTGADYVFHLDPWWNPAVEDQASDRAHRIGQDRPVTIYRLITEGTIEEKILALHGTKRQLADDLLSGLERSDVLDLDQLRALLGD